MLLVCLTQLQLHELKRTLLPLRTNIAYRRSDAVRRLLRGLRSCAFSGLSSLVAVENGGEVEDACKGCGGPPLFEPRPEAPDTVAVVVKPVWAGHGCLVALRRDRGSCRHVPDVVTGFLFRIRAVLRHPLVRRIPPDLHSEAARSPECALNARAPLQRRGYGLALLERAIVRGKFPAILDTKLALDLTPSPLYWRMVVVGATPSRGEVIKLGSAITAGLRALA